MTPENQTEPAATPNEAKNVIFEDPNLTLNDDSNFTQNLENEEMPRPLSLIQLIQRRKRSTEFSSKTSQNPSSFKAELMQLNCTQFPSLGFFVRKKVGNQKN